MLYDDLYLAHHGVKGQRWGIRRYQNSDGTLTKSGRKRFGGRYGERIVNQIESSKKGTGLSYDKVGRQILNDEASKMRRPMRMVRGAGIGAVSGAAIAGIVAAAASAPVAALIAPGIVWGGTVAGTAVQALITAERTRNISDIATAYEIPDLMIGKSAHRD